MGRGGARSRGSHFLLQGGLVNVAEGRPFPTELLGLRDETREHRVRLHCGQVGCVECLDYLAGFVTMLNRSWPRRSPNTSLVSWHLLINGRFPGAPGSLNSSSC